MRKVLTVTALAIALAGAAAPLAGAASTHSSWVCHAKYVQDGSWGPFSSSDFQTVPSTAAHAEKLFGVLVRQTMGAFKRGSAVCRPR